MDGHAVLGALINLLGVELRNGRPRRCIAATIGHDAGDEERLLPKAVAEVAQLDRMVTNTFEVRPRVEQMRQDMGP